MDNKANALKDIRTQTSSLLKLRKMVSSLPDGLPGPLYVNTYPDYISMHISFDINDLRLTRRLLGSAWHFSLMHTDDLGNRYITYLNNSNVEFTVIQTALGQTCKRVQVGERTVPVYKVVCS